MKISVVTVNYNDTKDGFVTKKNLTKRLVSSIKENVPQAAEIIVVDNSESTPFREAGVRTIALGKNHFHGPGMNIGIKESKNELVLVCDNDTVILRPGIAPYLIQFAAKGWLAIGMKITVDDKGYISKKGWDYIHPQCMLVQRHVYCNGSPFIHHGAPCLARYREDQSRLYDAPGISNYMKHDSKGTWRTPEYRAALGDG